MAEHEGDDGEDYSYINLLANPERYTGYAVCAALDPVLFLQCALRLLLVIKSGAHPTASDCIAQYSMSALSLLLPHVHGSLMAPAPVAADAY